MRDARVCGAGRYLVLVLIGVLLASCAPGESRGGSTAAEREVVQGRPTRTVVIAASGEATTAAEKGLQTAGFTGFPRSLFNAGLAFEDEQEVRHPYLVESLPELNTATWQVFPDGRMQTTYRLKSGLVWHDGTPLSAEDFVFALRIYKSPEYGSSNPRPQNMIERIGAGDDRTFTIYWTQPFAEAGSLLASDFQALPRHILAEPVEQLTPDAFAAHPFWTTEYVGLGPYRVDRWELGVAMEGVAFERYVRGRPQIDRVRFLVIPDANTVLANLLSGSVHIAVNRAVRFTEALTLMRQWNEGVVRIRTDGSRVSEFQLNPERVAPGLAGTLDVRVRRALAHATDKLAVIDAVFEGQGKAASVRVATHLDYFPLIERAIVKYPYDLRRSEQLMNEAGFVKGQDGVYVNAGGVRFEGEDMIGAAAESELSQQIQLHSWRAAGFDVRARILSRVEQQDSRLRAERPGLYTGDGGSMETLGRTHIPRAENRFTGSNRGSYVSAEYDRLLDVWSTSLDRSERVQAMVRMARLYTHDLPSIPLNYRLDVTPHVTALKGVTYGVIDIHTWSWAD